MSQENYQYEPQKRSPKRPDDLTKAYTEWKQKMMADDFIKPLNHIYGPNPGGSIEMTENAEQMFQNFKLIKEER